MGDVVKSGLSAAEGEKVDLDKASGNSAKVEFYISSATFSTAQKKDIQSLSMFLDGKKIKYETYDVASDKEARERMWEKSGQKTIPQLFINDKFIGSFDDVQYLEEVGELSKLLGSS